MRKLADRKIPTLEECVDDLKKILAENNFIALDPKVDQLYFDDEDMDDPVRFDCQEIYLAFDDVYVVGEVNDEDYEPYEEGERDRNVEKVYSVKELFELHDRLMDRFGL